MRSIWLGLVFPGLCLASLPHGMPLIPPSLANVRHLDARASLLFQPEAQFLPHYLPHALDTPISHFPNDERYSPHANGSFGLRYWFDARYHEPQGPVYILLGGETDAAGRLPFLESGILPILAEPTSGLSVILEHRYYGKSYVTKDLSTDSLRFLDTAQALADIAYFIQHVDIPNVGSIAHLPVILYGGSYAGAQAAFARKLYPDLVFGAIGSSAVTEAILEFSAYYEPIRQNAPVECVETLVMTTDIIDQFLAAGDETLTKTIKSVFGLANVTDDRDFVNALTIPLSYWQAQNWDEEVGSSYFVRFCDALAADSLNRDALLMDIAQGGLLQVSAYARFIREHVASLCPTTDQDECFGTFDAEAARQDGLSQHWRLWQYQVCQEWGYYIGGATSHLPSLVSRFLDLSYIAHICPLAYPPGNHTKVPQWPDVERINRYGGYNLTSTRLLYVDGSADAWLYATPHSPLAPTRPSDDPAEMYLIDGAGHHWDENGRARREPKTIREVHAREVAVVRSWLREWEARK